MNGLIWTGQVALACVFLALGTFKLFAFSPLTRILESWNMRLTITPLQARLLGIVEVLLAFGVLMPDLYADNGAVPEFVIVRLCAAGLAFLMLAAAAYHMRRKEPAALDIAILLLAIFVIVGRWP